MSSDRRRRHRAALRGRLDLDVRRNRVRPSIEGLEDRVVLSPSPLPGEVALSGPRQGAPVQIARDYLAEHGDSFGLGAGDLDRLVVTNNHTSTPSGVTYLYLRQGFNGLPVVDSDINVAVDRQGRILTIGGRFSPLIGSLPEEGVPAPGLSPAEALGRAVDALGLGLAGDITVVRDAEGLDLRGTLLAPGAARGEVPARLHYVAGPDGSPRLAWNFSVDLPDGSHWYDASVDAQTGALLRASDWVDNHTYNVFPPPARSPQDGPRTLVVDQHLDAPDASPDGWHTTDGRTDGPEFTDTRGNNVFAQEDADNNNTGGTRPDGGAGLVFDFPFDDTQAPANSQNASIVQTFFVSNVFHDVLHRYGFDEASGNFQQNNFGRGGQGGDAVQADVQDGSGTDNANFATPPDGTAGRMQMYIFTGTNPNRDAGFANEIVVHELGHGISNRLTGGAANSGALDRFQSRSMGEGWSDFYALMFTQDANDGKLDAYPQGVYVGYPNGVRRQPYSFDQNIYNYSYSDLGLGAGEFFPHPNGEIWAAALWDMNWLLVDRQGFSPDLYAPVDVASPEASSGNQVAMLLVTEALKLQPANPTYLQGRDAILRADQALFGGRYATEIWTAFARRGMGLSAVDTDLGTRYDDARDFDGIREAFDIPLFVDVAFNSAGLAGLYENSPLNEVVVGTLTDRFGISNPADYGATIDWGDGSPVRAATLRPNGAGGLDIIGSHTYLEGGPYEVTITADRDGSLPEVATFDLPVQSWPLFAQAGSPIVSREGIPLEDVPVGSFTDFDPQANPGSHYTVTIDWGDGVQSPGEVVRQADGGFDVFGSHTYREGGDRTYRLIVSEAGGQSSFALGQARIETFPVLATGGFSYTIQEGTPFRGPVARFVDLSPQVKEARSYSAVIDWGDGTTGPGTVVSDGGGAFTVLGEHTFSLPGGRSELPIRVTVFEGGGNSDTATSTAVVSDAPINAEGRRLTLAEGLFSGVVARFDDFNQLGTAGEFTATIDWGDGTTTPGVIEPDPEVGFLVLGTRDDLRAGTFTARIRVVSRGGSIAEATSTLVVSDAGFLPRAQPIAALAGPFSGVVATFVDLNPGGSPGDFSASISWGDGASSAGRMVQLEDGSFQVLGDHSFPAGTYEVVVTVTSLATGVRADAAATARIGSSPLTGLAVPIRGLELEDGLHYLGAVYTEDPFAGAGDFTVVIDWGDGTTSAGEVVVHPLGRESGFLVRGRHAYTRSGGFPVSVAITGPGGVQTSLSTSAAMDVVRMPVIATLAPGGLVSGFAVPGSTVILLAQRDGGEPFLIAEVPTNPADGGWTYEVEGLGDGSYALSAAAKNRSGVQNSPIVPIGGGPLVVDRSGPTVRDVFLDPRAGQVLVTLADPLSGLAPASLLSPDNYAVTDAMGRALRIVGVELSPPGADGSQVVILRLGSRGPLSRGGYTVTINGAAITDRAGNTLTESFFTPFPQFVGASSTTFVADIGTDGTRSTPPIQVIPGDQARGVGAFRRFIAAGFRRRPIQL
ncbi:extracellular metalloproteinase [Tautonia plasticadhaerens]|uniref:Fungalysin metallopeptidase (M36) n=1 Tax=Tautonia plasticadhaerens TaxID=2527974 RepID=A0A518GVK6_9BACT|nr:extracellular metalloproteinase [Tautonia plasticadhaerens]QDV32623.1 Fungalysin metallopeptidase (M36) [Tautonia plasticadhaerens]